MEKLLNLLNEYSKVAFEKVELGTFIPELGQEGVLPMHNRLIFCKDFGFIKWLVDNDKIDFDKTGYKKADFQEVWNGDWRTVRGYEMLLMLLSIQDNPIEFLISVLK